MKWPRVLAVSLVAFLAGAGSAQAQPYVYVTNQGAGNVSQFDGLGGLLVPLTPATVPAGGGATGIAVSPDGKSAYVANQFNNTVSQYDVGSDGRLGPKTPATVPAGQHPVGIAVSPDGKHVYVADFIGVPQVPGTVAQFSVGAGGALTPLTPATVPAGIGTDGVAVSKDGKSVYAVNQLDVLFQYDVGPSGALTPKSPPTTPNGSGGFQAVVSPDGQQLFVTVPPLGVLSLDIGVDGQITGAASGTFLDSAEGLAVSPDGKSLYVAQTGIDSVAQFDIEPTGALSLKSTPAIGASGSRPIGVAVAPDGKSVYVANSFSNSVSQFDVGAGGLLSPKSPPAVPAGGDPVAVAVTPPPRLPTSKEQCKNGGWKTYGVFKNQGDCVSFVATGGKNPPAG